MISTHRPGRRTPALLIAGLCLLRTAPLLAEVQIGGEVDLEVSAGGTASSETVNEIPAVPNGPHFSVHQVNLFLSARPVSSFTFNARLQENGWDDNWWSLPYFSMAAVTWEARNERLSVTGGRFLSPFGLYPHRQLGSENLFASAPLLYDYSLHLSHRLGYWPMPGEGTYPRGDEGASTLARGAYVTGASANWIVVPDRVNLEAALVNSALTSEEDYNSFANYGAVARLGLQPFIWWQQGFSISNGSFMQADPLNADYGSLGRFRQTVIGADTVLSYAWFELSGELALALWDVPRIDPDGTTPVENGELVGYSLKNLGGYVDLKFEPPFLSGSYLALRYERMGFLPYVDPQTGAGGQWDEDVTRVSIAVGYKVARPVLLKVAFSDQWKDGAPLNLDAYAVRGMVVMGF